MFHYEVSDVHELRLLDLRDDRELFALTDANRGDLRQWLPWLDSIERVDDTRRFIATTQQQFAHEEGFVAAICYGSKSSLLEQRRIVGTIGLNWIDRANRIGYIGYWLAPSHRGCGIMSASCQSLIDYAFSSLYLNRLVIACACENHRSRAIPERLGFKYEGVARDAEWLYDRFVDHHVYSLLAREWKGHNIGSRE
jgi:ribosomal-protein-serine acetyltransferase